MPFVVAGLIAVALSVPAAVAQPGADLRSAVLAADDARVQSAADRQVIAAALGQELPEVRVLALRAIGRTRRAEFLRQAVGGLKHPSLDVRREAAFAVAHIGSGTPDALSGAEQALRDAIGREPDGLVFAALAEEYGRLPFETALGIDEAARTLRAGLTRLGAGGPVPPFSELGVARAAEALARRAARLKASSADLRALIAHLYNPARVATDAPRDLLRTRMRRLAVSGLLSLDAVQQAGPAVPAGPAREVAGDARRAGPTTPVGPAVPAGPTATLSEAFDLAVTDTDAQVRRLGVIALSRRPALSPEQALAWLTDASMIVRHAAVALAGPRMPAIAEAGTRDAHVHVRLAALDALGAARACRVACTSRLDRPEPYGAAWHEGAHALEALARTNPEAARAHVTRATASEVWQVRMYAARAAQHTAQAEVLARLAADPDVNVRHAALVSWRAAELPGLTAAAVAALASDDGQLLLEAARALAPGPGVRVPGTEVIAALRDALRRATAQKRETSRDWRLALAERIDELDPERVTTLRPYLSDFDPAVADRVATLINARLRAGDAQAVAAPVPLPRTTVSSWTEVAALDGATANLRLRGGRQLTIRLYAQVAPTAVARLVTQVRAGEWNGRTFHRVEPGFVVQGGSPAANEYAGAANFARDEFSALSHVAGTVGISTRGPDTGDGQIFINLVDNARLDFGFTLVGSVTSNPAALDDLLEGDVIESATIAVAAR